jgi:hypothetical protein
MNALSYSSPSPFYELIESKRFWHPAKVWDARVNALLIRRRRPVRYHLAYDFGSMMAFMTVFMATIIRSIMQEHGCFIIIGIVRN